jgi:hypothetical protein
MFRAMLVVAATAGLACSPSHTEATDSTSSRDATSEGVGDAISVDALGPVAACSMLATAKCMKLMSCSPADLTHRFGDLGTCETREELACTDALAAADTGASAGSSVACGAALAASTCDDYLGGTPPDACQPRGSGTGTCAFAGQCSTAYCSVGANALCGLCQDEPTVGQSCSAAGCGKTLTCDGNNNLCEMAVGSGAACNPTTPCDHGLVCVGDTQQKNGSCKPVITTAGTTCDQTRKTAANCSGDGGLTCNTNTNKCVVQPFVAAGATCGSISGVGTDCSGGATCVIPTNQTTGICVAAAADGSACDVNKGPNCFNPARCIPTGSGTAGTCQLPGSSQGC